MPERQLRRVWSEAFKPNDEHLIPLPKVHDYRLVIIELVGSLTVASNNATSVPLDSPCGLIDRVDLVANGKDVLQAIPFVFPVMNNYEAGFTVDKTAPGVTQTAHPIRAIGFLDQFNQDGPRPKDSAFQAFLTQLFQLRLTTRDEDQIITKGSAVLTLDVDVNIYVDSLVEVGKDRGEPKAFKKVTSQSQTFSGSNTGYPFDLPVGNQIRHIAIRATDDGVPDNDLIGDVSFKIDDTDTRAAIDFETLRSVNQYDRDGAAPQTGFAVLDSSPEGKLSNAFDCSEASRAQLVVGVNTPGGTGEIEVVTTEYILP